MFLVSTILYLAFRCVPVPSNETCRDVVIGLESYAIDVAQIEQNIAIINVMESVRLAVLGYDLDPSNSCITLIDWVICIAKLPPCSDTKLILPCADTCGVILSFFTTCYNSVEEFADNDETVRDYFLRYRCRLPETYYDGYNEEHFVNTPCVGISLG